MRLVRVPLDSSLRPVEALRAVRMDERPFALIGRWAGGGAVLGAHKWVDRALLAGREPLIVDITGEVLETGSGNVFLVEGHTLVTPPADGRILPGIVRAQVMREEQVVEEPVDLGRLRDADEVFVTSSIRGRQTLRRQARAAALA